MDEEITEVYDTREQMPSWFTELLDRLMQVFTKLLIKLGIKIAL